MARKKGEGSFQKCGDYHKWTLDLGKDPITKKPRYKVIKRRDLKEVKRLVREYLRNKEDGVPSTQGNELSGDQWAVRWLETVRLHRERKTHKSYSDTWRIWLQPHLGKQSLEKIGTSHIQAACDDARKAGHNATPRYILVVAKMFCNAARRHSPPYMKHNPCEGVVVPEAAPPRERILSHDEAMEVLEELYRYVDHKTTEGGHYVYGHRHIIRFLLETGVRESEALGLQEIQVKLKATPPTVRVAAQLDEDEDGKPVIKPYTKGKNVRTVPLTPAAVEAITEHRKMVAAYREKAQEAYDEWGLVFPSEEGTPIGQRNLIRTVEAIREAVDKARKDRDEEPMPHWTPHDLRRTFGTRIAQTGAGLKVTQKLLGHASPTTTAKIYIIAEEDELNAAVANMRNTREA